MIRLIWHFACYEDCMLMMDQMHIELWRSRPYEEKKSNFLSFLINKSIPINYVYVQERNAVSGQNHFYRSLSMPKLIRVILLLMLLDNNFIHKASSWKYIIIFALEIIQNVLTYFAYCVMQK